MINNKSTTTFEGSQEPVNGLKTNPASSSGEMGRWFAIARNRHSGVPARRARGRLFVGEHKMNPGLNLESLKGTSSVLIHRLSLMSGRTVLAFAYFSIQKRGVMTPENIVGSLIKQIISSDVKDGMLPRFIEDYYDTNVGIARPSLVGLSSLLAMASRSFSRVFIVVDGVDELEEETQKVMIRLSKLFFRQNSARLLVSSRPHMPRLSRYLFPAFSLKITGQDTDIRKFVKSRIMEDFKLRMIIGGDHSLADKIARDIAVRSQGQ